MGVKMELQVVIIKKRVSKYTKYQKMLRELMYLYPKNIKYRVKYFQLDEKIDDMYEKLEAMGVFLEI